MAWASGADCVGGKVRREGGRERRREGVLGSQYLVLSFLKVLLAKVNEKSFMWEEMVHYNKGVSVWKDSF